MGNKDQYHTNIWHAIVAMYYRIMKQFPFVKTRYWIMDTFSASFMEDNYIDLIYCEPFVDKINDMWRTAMYSPQTVERSFTSQ